MNETLKNISLCNFSDISKYYVDTLDEARKIMEHNPKAIFFNNRETEIGLEGLPCLIRAAKRSYLKTSIAFAFQKNSPYTKMFSYFFLKMMESGQVSQMYRKHLNTVKSLKHRNDVCSRKVDECLPNQSDCVPPVGIKTVCTAGLIALLGIIFGAGTVIVEICHKRRQKHKEFKRKLLMEDDSLPWQRRTIIITTIAAVFLGSFTLLMYMSYIIFLM